MHNAEDLIFFSVLFVYLPLFPHNSISICLIVVLIDDSSVRFANIQLSNWALFTTWAASYALPKMRKRIEQPIKLYILFLFCTKFHLTACHLNTFFSGNAFTFAFDPLKSDKILNSHVNCLVFFSHAILLDIFYLSLQCY